MTADIELLEVFYAHTISPICHRGHRKRHHVPALWAATHRRWGCTPRWPTPSSASVSPVAAAKRRTQIGRELPRGVRCAERLCAGQPARACGRACNTATVRTGLAQINQRTDALAGQERRLKRRAARQQAVTGAMILLLDAVMLAAGRAPLRGGRQSGLTARSIPVVALHEHLRPRHRAGKPRHRAAKHLCRRQPGAGHSRRKTRSCGRLPTARTLPLPARTPAA